MPNIAEEPLTSEAAGIDETISRVERLYETMTGRPVSPFDAGLTPIPVERNPGEYVEEQLNRLLELLGSFPDLSRMPATAASTAVYVPTFSVCETRDEIVVRVDLPGVRREDVRVTMNGSVLTISGTRTPYAAAGETVRLAESPSGAFRRVLVMAGAARGAEPSARLKDGVLEVRIARDAPPAPSERPVPVN